MSKRRLEGLKYGQKFKINFNGNPNVEFFVASPRMMDIYIVKDDGMQVVSHGVLVAELGSTEGADLIFPIETLVEVV